MARDANDGGVGALNYFYDLPARGETTRFATYIVVIKITCPYLLFSEVSTYLLINNIMFVI